MHLERILKCLFLAGTLAVTGSAFENDPEIQVSFQKGAVVITTPKGAHIKKSFTEVSLASKPGSIKAGPLPRADAKDELNEDIYHGTIRIPVSGEGLKGEVALEVQFQPCTEGEGGTASRPPRAP